MAADSPDPGAPRSKEHRFRFDRITIREGVKDLAVFEPDGQLGGDVAHGGRMIIDFVNGRFEIAHRGGCEG